MTDSDAGVETEHARSHTLDVVPDRAPKPLTPKTYKIAFAGRVRLARESAGLATSTVARELRVPYNTCMQYEDPKKPSLMPHVRVGTFCRLCGLHIVASWLESSNSRIATNASADSDIWRPAAIAANRRFSSAVGRAVIEGAVFKAPSFTARQRLLRQNADSSLSCRHSNNDPTKPWLQTTTT